MRILITGITGFVGSHLAEYAVRSGWTVIGTSFTGCWRHGVSQAVTDGIEVRPWDITQPASAETLEWVREFAPEAIVHLAGASIPADCGADEPTTRAVATNVDGTRHVLQVAAKCAEVPRFLLASSCHVYAVAGDRPGWFKETDQPAPANGYGKTKLAAEQVTADFARKHETPVVIARGFQHTGPRHSSRMLLPEWTIQLVRGAPTLNVRCLETSLDLMDVRDTVRDYAALVSGAEGFTTVNVGSGRVTTGAEIVAALRQVAGRDFPVVSAKATPTFNPIADVSCLQSLLGERSAIELSQTVADTWAYWNEMIQAGWSSEADDGC